MIKHFCDTCKKELKAGEIFTDTWCIQSTWLEIKIKIEQSRHYCWNCIKHDVNHALDFSMKQPGNE